MRSLTTVTMARPLSRAGERCVARLIDRAVKRGRAVNKITTAEEVIVHIIPAGAVTAALRDEQQDRQSAVLVGAGRE